MEAERAKISPESTFLILMILAFISPIGILIDGQRVDIYGIFWWVATSNWFFRISFGLDMFSIVYIPRFLYPYFIMRVYQGKMKLRTAFWFGLVGELYILILSLFRSSLVFEHPEDGILIGIPTPIMLILSLLIVKLVPIPEYTPQWLEKKNQ